MKPSEKCKAAGLPGLAYLARRCKKSEQTLINWNRDQPELFDLLVRGAASEIEAERPHEAG